jgi:cyclopropane-fatty-acyl-phospholipid synthase
MSPSPAATQDPVALASLTFLRNLLEHYPRRDFSIRCWDGSEWAAEAGQPERFTLVLRHPGTLRRMFWPPKMLTLCEAFLHEDIDLEGDLEAFWALIQYLYVEGLPRGMLERKRVQQQLATIPDSGPPRQGRRTAQLHGAPSSVERDRQAISSHYDVSNDFYALWLDRRMVYSCAYFTDPDVDLDQAQEDKLDYICRKLRLQPGERLLDIGCGWGGLISHAARHYGIEAVGITISQAQAELANERIRQAGLSHCCRAELCDYRQLQGRECFDKIVSVGMFEHVGESMLPVYFRQAWQLLKPGGVFLNHAIALHVGDPLPVGLPFNYLYIFPDSQLEPISTTLRVAESTGFELRDVECLREHYILTLRHWQERLLNQADKVRQLTSVFTYRVYRLYLAAAIFGFVIGQPTIYQSLLVKPQDGRSGLPLTRADWYRPLGYERGGQARKVA